MILPPPTSTLFPYTTLFRSGSAAVLGAGGSGGFYLGHQVRQHPRACGLVEGGRAGDAQDRRAACARRDRKSTRLNSSHANISYAVFCLKKKKKNCTRRVFVQ